jgi:hypothetical protein
MKTETTGRNKKTPIVAIQRIDVTGQYLWVEKANFPSIH